MSVSNLVCGVLVYACVLLGVAFFTLSERQTLGYMQIRKGPNKVGLFGVFQPFADAIKLFSKEVTGLTYGNRGLFFIAPGASMMLSLAVWEVCPTKAGAFFISLGVLYFLCISSLNVYTVMVAGWSSNSKYSLLGSIRAVAQTISYEISMALILIFLMMSCKSFNLNEMGDWVSSVWGYLLMISPLGVMWLISCVAETYRAPFDFAEGESELVSGFNVEYSGSGFALIFMGEYASIMVMSVMSSVLLFGTWSGSGYLLFNISFVGEVVAVAALFVWVRACLPRLRYDYLMELTWKFFLPVCLSLTGLMGGVIYGALFSES